MKIMGVFFLLVFSGLLQAEDSKPSEFRVLVSEDSEVKKDYLLTRKKFIECASHADDFGKVSWTVPEIVKMAEKHINEVQVPKVAPSIIWPLEGYNNGKEYPVGAVNDLNFSRMSLLRHEEFLYWKLEFRLVDGIGAGHTTCVVCYLNGEIAKIVDHKPDEVDPQVRPLKSIMPDG